MWLNEQILSLFRFMGYLKFNSDFMGNACQSLSCCLLNGPNIRFLLYKNVGQWKLFFVLSLKMVQGLGYILCRWLSSFILYLALLWRCTNCKQKGLYLNFKQVFSKNGFQAWQEISICKIDGEWYCSSWLRVCFVSKSPNTSGLEVVRNV